MPEIPLLIAMAALVGAAFSARGVWQRRQVSRRPEVEATVTGTELVELGSRVQNREGPEQERRYLARVHLRYRMAGQEVRSDNGRFDGAPTFTSRETAEAYLADFPEGRTLRVRVDLRAPERIQLGASRIPTRRIGLTLFLLAMAGFALFIYRQ
ncbi:DUF3592 domain-containing protein [Halomonas ventosae]|uniref:Uncharacterized protein DUF3592 n=1 Tax=Halomonas ventosae TaxID=229007 RepID=A0A2T0VR51_9GAMM|nr:DUF3592 domain-containing protein [Halomonas ventosae]PRY72993.1 uncharacterized protein DUF3592 [Halomonas ventosae]